MGFYFLFLDITLTLTIVVICDIIRKTKMAKKIRHLSI